MGSLLAAALARAQGFLLEPAPPGPARGTPAPASLGWSDSAPLERVEVVVTGLSAGSGVTTLARGLAAMLAVPGARCGQLLALSVPGAGSSPFPGAALSGDGAWEIPAGLSEPEEVREYGSMVARLAAGPAALIWDVPSVEMSRATEVACAAARVVLVAPGSGEPALAELVAQMLAERFGHVLLVANRVGDPGRWRGRAAACIPDSRLGAALAVRGRRPGGAFGDALDELAALVEERRGVG